MYLFEDDGLQRDDRMMETYEGDDRKARKLL